MTPIPSRQQLYHSIVSIVVVVIALLIGITIATSSRLQTIAAPESGGDALLEMPPPQSIDELLRPAHIVVIGSIGPIVQQGDFAGYDSKGTMLRVASANAPGAGGMPFVDYRVVVEHVLKDDGTIAAGRQLIVRMPGDPTRGINRVGSFPVSVPGDHHLFILSENPDKTTYGFYYGPWSRLNIDGQAVTASDTGHTPMFGKNVPPASFMRELTAALKTMH